MKRGAGVFGMNPATEKILQDWKALIDLLFKPHRRRFSPTAERSFIYCKMEAAWNRVVHDPVGYVEVKILLHSDLHYAMPRSTSMRRL